MRDSLWFLTVSLGIFLTACSGDKGSPNAAPTFTSSNGFSVEESLKTTSMTLTASDANGDPISFSLEGTDSQWFTLDADTGVLAFVEPPDFEAPLDQNGDNLYELTAVVRDNRGSRTTQKLDVQVTNVTFAFDVVSPRPGMLLELERYSRVPIGVRVEYDYPERLQIICNGEILNPASEARATWTGSLAIASGPINVNMVFWRDDQVLATHTVPVRHQHMISAHDYLTYDSINDLAVIPHPERREALVVNLENGASRKLYPWNRDPDFKGTVFDSIRGSTLFTDGDGLYQLDSATGAVTNILSDLGSAGPYSSLALDTGNNRLYMDIAGNARRYAQVDLGSGAAQDFLYNSQLPPHRFANAQLAYDGTHDRLMVTQENAAGVDVLAPGDNNPIVSFPPTWAHPQRFGEVEFHAERETLFITGYSGNGLLGLNLITGAYSPISGANLILPDAADRGDGPLLHAPNAMALDSRRDQLLTTSTGRLLAVDPDTGNRTSILDSSVGSGALTSGFAGLWVAPDGSRAAALDRQPGRFYDIDLRTGEKTAKSYTPALAPWAEGDAAQTNVLAQVYFRLISAKFNAAGNRAVIYYRTRDVANAGEEYLDLVQLETGSSVRLLRESPSRSHVDFNFSQPDDQLLLLMRDGSDYLLWFYSLEQGEFTQKQNLNLPPGFTPLALHRINQQIYLLGKVGQHPDASFALYELNNASQPNLLFNFEDKGTGRYSDADIDTLYNHSQLVLVLPEQEPKFWNIADQSEVAPAFTSFPGSDQARDFYSIDDFDEVYYFRANAGLHFCWRYNCGVLAN